MTLGQHSYMATMDSPRGRSISVCTTENLTIRERRGSFFSCSKMSKGPQPRTGTEAEQCHPNPRLLRLTALPLWRVVFGPRDLNVAIAHPATALVLQARKKVGKVKGQRTKSTLARLCPFIWERRFPSHFHLHLKGWKWVVSSTYSSCIAASLAAKVCISSLPLS